MPSDDTQQSADDALYRHILASTPDALIYADRDGIIRAWNAGAERVFGFSAAQALGHSWADKG